MDNNMQLFDTISSDIKTFMKSKDSENVILLRGVIAKIKDETINKGKPIDDATTIRCIEKTVKEIDQSIESYKVAGREEMVKKLIKDKETLSKFLPKMLNDEETRVEIENIIKNIEPIKKNIGMIMKQLPINVNKGVASKILNTILK